MSDTAATTPKPDFAALLGIPANAHAAPAFAPDLETASQDEEVSVAGVMLLTAVSCGIAIMGVFALALFVIACWWVIVHIPVPPFVAHLLARLGLG